MIALTKINNSSGKLSWLSKLQTNQQEYDFEEQSKNNIINYNYTKFKKNQ